MRRIVKIPPAFRALRSDGSPKEHAGVRGRLSRALFGVVVLVSAVSGVACQETRRLPYIEPVLHAWPEEYHGEPGLRLHVFHTGSIELPGRLIYEGGSLARRRTLTVLSFAIQHPEHGLVLVGTGLNRNIADDAPRYLGPIRSVLGQAELHPGQDILAQLDEAQLTADTVGFVIMPDLRLDHTGEVEAFPQAEVIVARAEHVAADAGATSDLRHVVNLGLYMPDEFDQVAKWQFIDFADDSRLATFLRSHDLFGDGSIVLLDARGATAGGLAVLVRLPSRPVLLCGNLAWTESQARFAWMPGLAFERAAWWEAIWRLKKMKDLVPALGLLPGHDLAAARTAASQADDELVVHEFSAPERDDSENGRAAPGSEASNNDHHPVSTGLMRQAFSPVFRRARGR